jgi:hypothetical protein
VDDPSAGAGSELDGAVVVVVAVEPGDAVDGVVEAAPVAVAGEPHAANTTRQAPTRALRCTRRRAAHRESGATLLPRPDGY